MDSDKQTFWLAVLHLNCLSMQSSLMDRAFFIRCNAGIKQFQDLYHNGTFVSFQYLCNNFNIPRIHLFFSKSITSLGIFPSVALNWNFATCKRHHSHSPVTIKLFVSQVVLTAAVNHNVLLCQSMFLFDYHSHKHKPR